VKQELGAMASLPSERDPTNDVNFLNEIVLPTVADFSRHPGDIRLGVLACLVLQAMNEHYFLHNTFDPKKTREGNDVELGRFKKSLRDGDWVFGEIMDIANGAKHAKERFFDLHLQQPNVCGVMRCGFPLSSADHVFTDDENSWLLYQLTEHVTKVWKTKLGIVT
jgi:hypothetical protein